ncbi:MAG: dockerin type I domain-containing protein [Pirellulales bacterium]
MFFSKRKTSSRRSTHQRRVRLEQLEDRKLMAYGALSQDTAEFMLGSVVVTPVFFESNGTIDTSSEDWTPSSIQQTLDKISQATDWWVQTLDSLHTVHHLSFTIDTTFANTPFQTGYEPISRRSNDYSKYVTEFLQSQGATTTDIETEMFKFNNAQRQKYNTDWSFTMIVVNSYNQGTGQFAAGGSFSKAFSFAGGLFMVVPSSRPASTFAHETGHIFWARDEYAGAGSSGSYNGRRGYYNARNENAIDQNPNPNFVQQPSIMATGSILDAAWNAHVSAASTLAQIGWQDSDGDGIFDVLDVPLELLGTGYVDLATGKYRFKGSAKVQTLPNLNSAGYRSDITTNKITDIEYRFDNGAWQSYSQPNSYQTTLDLDITVPSGVSTIQIRARDSESTVTSNLFQGRLSRADATVGNGINGFAWIDVNKNGLRDAGEYGQSGWTVALVDSSGQNIQIQKQIEPDSLSNGPVGTTPINGAVLGSVGSSTDGRVGVLTDPDSLTGNKVFTAYSTSAQTFVNTWNETGRQFQATFVADTTTVSLEAIGIGTGSYGRLEAYNSLGQLVGRYTTKSLTAGQTETMTISRGVGDISYVVAFGTAKTNVKLDNLRYGAPTTVQTDSQGHYYFPSLPAGQYQVRATASSGYNALSPSNGTMQAAVTTNAATSDIDFGFVPAGSDWQNPRDRYDVNDNSLVSPVDALLVINALNSGGGRILAGSGFPTSPYIDVTGDGVLSPVDALLVINFLNQNRGGGESESGSPGSSPDSQINVGGGCSVWEYGAPPINSPFGEGELSEDELLFLLAQNHLDSLVDGE